MTGIIDCIKSHDPQFYMGPWASSRAGIVNSFVDCTYLL